MSERGHRERRGLIALALALGATVLAIDVVFYSDTLEDAFITFRYSLHLADGRGLGAWNLSGERVEGYTSTLWMLWLAAAPPLGIRIETLAKWTGLASQLGLCLLLIGFPFWRRSELISRDRLLGADREVYWIAAVILGLYLPACWYAVSGMEVMSFALLVGLALLLPACTRSAPAIAGVFAALVLMRPEGALVGIGLAGFQLFARWRRRLPLSPAVVALGATLATVLALTALRLAVFGELLPNTYFAKVAGAEALHRRLGTSYLRSWSSHHLAWLAAAAAALCSLAISLRRNGFEANAALASIFALSFAYAGYVWLVGGDNPTAFPYWRQWLHLSPLIALILASGIAWLSRRRSVRILLVAVLVISVNYQLLGAQQGRLRQEIGQSLRDRNGLTHRPPNPLYVWLSEISLPDTTIASAAAGQLPFVVDAVHIDMLGLNDRDIAHHGRFDPKGPIDSKSDVDSVMRRRPDIIQSTLYPQRFENVSPRPGQVWHRAAMTSALLDHPVFRSEYVFVRNAPYGPRDRAILLRRGFWEAHPLRDSLDCVPVTQTAMYPRPAD